MKNKFDPFTKLEQQCMLSKLESTNDYQPYVQVGDSGVGLAHVLSWDDGKFCIAVSTYGARDYLRTSLVQSIMDETDDSITFKTLNSVYKLEKYKEKEND